LGEEVAAYYVDGSQQFSAAASCAVLPASASEVESRSSLASSHDADAWELVFSDDDLLLPSLL